MLVFLARRILQLIPVVLFVSFAIFMMLHLMPGDPARIMLGEHATTAELEILREHLGLNNPWYIQYFHHFGRLLMGDWGTSIRTGRPVLVEIFDTRFFNTFQLAVMGTTLTAFLGLTMGIISAAAQRKKTLGTKILDNFLILLSLGGLSMPNFWLGILLIWTFALNIDWLQIAGWGTPNQMVLPVVMLGISGSALIHRMTRNSLIEVLNQDYIRTAHAKGLSERVVIYKHALRNALIPVVTVVGLQFGHLLAGAIVTETIFAINGLGRLVLDSIRMQDFPLAQGAILVISLIFVVVNCLVDITYRLVNKRIDTQ